MVLAPVKSSSRITVPESPQRPVLAVAAVVTALVILILAAVGIPVRADSGGSSPPGTPGADAGSDSAEAVLVRMRAAYQRIQSFEAKFIQTSTGMSFPTPVIQEGTVQVQKPDKLRWQFSGDRPKLFLSDGVDFWVIDESEKTCTHFSSMMGSLRSFLAFFNGMADVAEHYRVTRVAAGPELREGASTLELRPKVKDGVVDVIYLHIDVASGLITGVVTSSSFGDRTEISLAGLQAGKAQPIEHFRWHNRAGFQMIEGD